MSVAPSVDKGLMQEQSKIMNSIWDDLCAMSEASRLAKTKLAPHETCQPEINSDVDQPLGGEAARAVADNLLHWA